MDRLELIIAVSDVILNRYSTKETRKRKLRAKFGAANADIKADNGTMSEIWVCNS